MADVGLWLTLLVTGEFQYLFPAHGRIIPHPGIAVPLWALMTLALLSRRQHPWVLLWASVLGATAEALSGRGTSVIAGLVLLIVAVYTVARYDGRLERMMAATLLTEGAFLIHDYRDPTRVNHLSQVITGYVVLLLATVVGRFLQVRDSRYQALQSEVADQTRQREEVARAAIAAERTRIARELHDVIAHSVSVVIVQAAATLGELDDDNVPSARKGVAAIEDIARQALGDMRRLVAIGVEDADGELGPQPGIESLPALVSGVAGAGVDVEFDVEGPARPLPAGVGLTLYRVAQEALTNAVNHAPGAAVKVRVNYRETAVELEVVNGVATEVDRSPRGGNGLIGMRERTALYGGTLAVETLVGGGFSVRAILPVEEALA